MWELPNTVNINVGGVTLTFQTRRRGCISPKVVASNAIAGTQRDKNSKADRGSCAGTRSQTFAPPP